MNQKKKKMTSVSGYLEIMDEEDGFLRDVDSNYQPDPSHPYVPRNMISRYNLREGSLIKGTGADRGQGVDLVNINTIDGMTLRNYRGLAPLQSRISINPMERFNLTLEPGDATGRALDLIVPVGKGQRGLVVAPPKSGKTTILRHMANAITQNHPDTRVFVLLVDERPEEVTDFKRGLSRAHVLYSSADQSIEQHMRMTRIAVHTAIRCTEAGEDAVVFIDSLTRMSRAFNISTDSRGKTLTGGLGANAMAIPRKIFGAARNIEGGGSLTIIATILVNTGSRMDDIIFQEFKGTGNMDLFLSRPCAEQRIWPAIDINQSGTRKEDLLLTKEEYQEVLEIRKELADMDEVDAMAALLERLSSR